MYLVLNNCFLFSEVFLFSDYIQFDVKVGGSDERNEPHIVDSNPNSMENECRVEGSKEDAL